MTEAQIEPRFDAAFRQVVHDVVEPREIVLAEDLFAFHPAGLAAGELHAAFAQEIVGFRGVEGVAVERLEADPERGLGDVPTAPPRHVAQQTRSDGVLHRVRFVVEEVFVSAAAVGGGEFGEFSNELFGVHDVSSCEKWSFLGNKIAPRRG